MEGPICLRTNPIPTTFLKWVSWELWVVLCTTRTWGWEPTWFRANPMSRMLVEQSHSKKMGSKDQFVWESTQFSSRLWNELWVVLCTTRTWSLKPTQFGVNPMNVQHVSGTVTICPARKWDGRTNMFENEPNSHHVCDTSVIVVLCTTRWEF